MRRITLILFRGSALHFNGDSKVFEHTNGMVACATGMMKVTHNH